MVNYEKRSSRLNVWSRFKALTRAHGRWTSWLLSSFFLSSSRLVACWRKKINNKKKIQHPHTSIRRIFYQTASLLLCWSSSEYFRLRNEFVTFANANTEADLLFSIFQWDEIDIFGFFRYRLNLVEHKTKSCSTNYNEIIIPACKLSIFLIHFHNIHQSHNFSLIFWAFLASNNYFLVCHISIVSAYEKHLRNVHEALSAFRMGRKRANWTSSVRLHDRQNKKFEERHGKKLLIGHWVNARA